MHLKILLPFRVFADTDQVLRLVVGTAAGSFGVLPQRLDCVATLVPGILEYQTAADGVTYVALDSGVLVKAASEVLISVRRAFAGADLGQLRQQIDQEFLTLSDEQKSARSVMAKLEGGLLRRFAELQHE